MPAAPLLLNLGSGPSPIEGWVNVDIEPRYKPDCVVDLRRMPWPFGDATVDELRATHILEHMADWEGFLRECARILKPGAPFLLAFPHYNDIASMTERTHLHVFSPMTFKSLFHGIPNPYWDGREHLQPPVKRLPLRCDKWGVVMVGRWCWLPAWLQRWCANHLLGVAIEQRFYLRRLPNVFGNVIEWHD